MRMQCLLQIDALLQVNSITPGRAATILPAVLGVISLLAGWLTLSRSWHRTAYRRLVAIAALAIALICIILSGMHLIHTTSIGTGSGRLGAIVALVLGLVGVVLSTLVLVRSRKSTSDSSKEKP